nr:uncharacterized protein LOC105846764 [Hydra vulgaris]
MAELEDRSRRNNLLFEGIEETEGETWKNNYKDRETILDNYKKLKLWNEKMYINEDFSERTINIRKQLFIKAKEIRSSETWCTEEDFKSNSNLHLTGFNTVFLERNVNKGGGGVLFYIKENLAYNILSDMSVSDDNIEILTVEIINKKSKNILLSCCYRPPTGRTGNKAIGPDDINGNIVIDSFNEIKDILFKVFKASITQGLFPNSLKIAKVTPIFKTGGHTNITNYRPISVLPVFSKILERIMYNRIYTYLIDNELLYKNQFGFQRNSSTEHAILQVTRSIADSFKNSQFTLGIFIDLSKAFDTINDTVKNVNNN